LKSLLALLAVLSVCDLSYSAELFGSVEAMSGSAYVSNQQGESVKIYTGQKIYEGQTVKTSPDGEVHLVTEDGGIIALRPDTEFRVDEYKADGDPADKIFMSLLKGTMRSITGWIGKHNTSAYSITTPHATIGIRGTDHETTVIATAGGDEMGTYDTVIEGATLLKTQHGTADVTPGKFAFAPKNKEAPPSILTTKPNYWMMRSLKIEGRIQQRKEFLHNRMEQMREERISQSRSTRGEHHEHLREREHKKR
jgi:hypothetical protein